MCDVATLAWRVVRMGRGARGQAGLLVHHALCLLPHVPARSIDSRCCKRIHAPQLSHHEPIACLARYTAAACSFQRLPHALLAIIYSTCIQKCTQGALVVSVSLRQSLIRSHKSATHPQLGGGVGAAVIRRVQPPPLVGWWGWGPPSPSPRSPVPELVHQAKQLYRHRPRAAPHVRHGAGGLSQHVGRRLLGRCRSLDHGQPARPPPGPPPAAPAPPCGGAARLLRAVAILSRAFSFRRSARPVAMLARRPTCSMGWLGVGG